MRRSRKFLFGAALGAMLVATQPAQADPISGFIVTALSYIGVTTTTAAVTTFLVATTLSTGLSYLSQVLRGGQQKFGIQTTLQSGGTVPRRFPIGLAQDPGSEAYPARTWGKFDGTPNAYFTRWIALSDLPTTLTGFICDDKVCTYGAGEPDADLGYAIPEFRGGEGRDHLWVKFFDGTQTTADVWSVANFGDDPDYPYGSDQVGYGIAWARVTARIDKYFFSNFPNYKFILGGVKLYDPTLDSTVGGSGAQRWDDPTTWAVSNAPAVVKYNVLRGISYDGQWLYGLQNSHAGCCPLDSWFAAINANKALIEYQPGVPVPQFRCGGMVSVDTAPADLLTELNKCDNGRLTEAGGLFITRSGAIGAPVMSFTDADLLITEAKQFDPSPGQEETYNAVTATWPDPAQNWTMVDAPALFDADLEAADGGKRQILPIAYNFVPYGDQVQGLMKFARDEKRKFRKHTVIAPPRAVVLDPFDAVAWTSTENGYVNKIEEVIPADQDNLDQGLKLTEGDPADYDWNGETDYRTYTPVPIAGQVVPSQAMVGWAVEQAIIYGDDGRAKPGIKVEWGTADIDDVDGVIIEIRLTSSAAIVWSGETPHSIEQFNLGEFIPPANLSADTAYQVRGKYRPISTRDTDWSGWLDITTPDIAIERIDFGPTARQLMDFTGQGFADVLDQLHGVSQTAAELGLGAAANRQEIRRSLQAVGDLTASFDERITVATNEVAALAEDVTALDAALPGKADASALTATNVLVDTQGGQITVLSGQTADLSATIGGSYSPSSTVATAIAAKASSSDLTTTANLLDELNSSYGLSIATARLRFTTEASLGGATTTIGLSAATSDAGGSTNPGLYITASGGDGSVWLVGQRTVITDGLDAASLDSALVISGGTLYIKSIKADTVETNHLKVGSATTVHRGAGSITPNTSAQTIISSDVLNLYGGNPVSIGVTTREVTSGTAHTFTYIVAVTITDGTHSKNYTFTKKVDRDTFADQNECFYFLCDMPASFSGTGTCTVFIQGSIEATGGSNTQEVVVYQEQVLR